MTVVVTGIVSASMRRRGRAGFVTLECGLAVVKRSANLRPSDVVFARRESVPRTREKLVSARRIIKLSA